MKIRLLIASTTVAVAVGGVAVGYIADRNQDPTQLTGASRPASTQYLAMESVETYQNLDELAVDTELSALFTAGPSTVEAIDGLPFTVTDVTVTEVIAGDLKVGQVLKVRQTGAAGKVEIADGPAVINRGEQYAAALSAFHWQEGDNTGQWVVLADALWRSTDGEKLQRTATQGALPVNTTVDALKTAFKSRSQP